METIFINTENSKTNEPHKCVLKLSQRLDLRGSNKHVRINTNRLVFEIMNIRWI